jgi:hypothetical protein
MAGVAIDSVEDMKVRNEGLILLTTARPVPWI